METSGKTSGLTAAAADRSILARRKVEEALSTMRASGDAITFKTLAEVAGVSRQYLYDNFKDQIEDLRFKTVNATISVGGEDIKVRSAGRVATIELALRNKISRLEEELKEARKEGAISKRRLEKALGEAEEWRTRHRQAVSELLDLRSRVAHENRGG